ncbi:hypothetical protein [Lewinella sp. W8]|uniref:hypothetical protein n=1 Tax=Lewinella sp. W8 TaxID=2528208 RepID=UPI0010683F53|nr:hypothetical protein [Lewinella sp. W8]MTB51724.1 hypothetical protein [Lewinella sp. W8]
MLHRIPSATTVHCASTLSIVGYVSLFLLFSVILSSCGSPLREVTHYYLDEAGKRRDVGDVKETYYVDRKTGSREGPYRRYGQNRMLIEEGQYERGIKIGSWKRWETTDAVWIYKDHDRSGPDSAGIPPTFLRYPMHLAETLDPLPGGVMQLRGVFSANCSLQSAIITQGVHPALDSITLQRFVRYARLREKYGQSIPECTEAGDTLITLQFVGG